MKVVIVPGPAAAPDIVNIDRAIIDVNRPVWWAGRPPVAAADRRPATDTDAGPVRKTGTIGSIATTDTRPVGPAWTVRPITAADAGAVGKIWTVRPIASANARPVGQTWTIGSIPSANTRSIR